MTDCLLVPALTIYYIVFTIMNAKNIKYELKSPRQFNIIIKINPFHEKRLFFVEEP